MAMVESGVDSSCAVPAARVASEANRSCPGGQFASAHELPFARFERGRHAEQKVHDEGRRDSKGNPHTFEVQAHVIGVAAAPREIAVALEKNGRTRQ